MKIITWAFLSVALMACSGGTGQDVSKAPATDTDTAEAIQEQPEASSPPSDEAPGAETDKRKNVLDYYRSLEPPYNSPYELTQKENKWIAESTLEMEVDATVDLKNGFIEIIDEGTGGGTYHVQVVLFRLANGNPMIAVSKKAYDGFSATQEYHFLRPEHPDQYDWTEHTLGALSVFDFLEPDYAEDPKILEEALPVLLDLPQQGTTLTASVFTGKRFYYCGDSASPEEQVACPAFDRLRREEIKLHWDRASGQFLFPPEE
ncbi:hypothetical protein [Phaeodactylibacter xiamenensis]|uniref:hypothetical protein n=1 Tax=Phaeodactylibacter xiamenensis TaxID=1524460 RepID=UPI0024A89E22|nr:hypothetical protein [Phaeodactylibacter xiamenensis]